MPDRITPAQIRGARGLLDWSMAQFAEAAQLSVSTIKRMEMAEPQPISDAAFRTARDAFEAAGIRFLDDSGAGHGVLLRTP